MSTVQVSGSAVTCVCRGLLPGCPLCGGTGRPPDCICGGLRYIATAKRVEGQLVWEVAVCPRCGQQSRQQVTVPSGLADGMEEYTFVNAYTTIPTLKGIAADVEAYAIGGRGWLVFTSPWGRGKTYLQAALVNKFRESGRPAQYWVSKTMLSWLHDCNWSQAELSLGAAIRRLSTVQLLCLDEFGHEELTAWQEAQLRAVLVARSDPVWLPTVFATNQPLEKFNMTLPWLASRWQRPEVKMVQFRGVPDLRSVRDVQLG